MRLDLAACWDRLRASEHGVLATVHERRGVDAVPVVYAVEGDHLVVPVDTVKPKSTTRLQRIENLERDRRCVLLVDRYDADWSRLWWVRVHADATVVDGMAPALARFAAYCEPGAVERTIVLSPTAVTGWAASD